MQMRKQRTFIGFAFAFLLLVSATARGRVAMPDLEKAPVPEWIWGAQQARDSEMFDFRKTFELTDAPKAATLWATCDNEMWLSVNGRLVKWSNQWQTPVLEDVAHLLHAGRNAIAVHCANADGPAGLIVKLHIDLPDAKEFDLATDKTWRVTAAGGKGWQDAKFDDSSWEQSYSIGKYGIGPWADVGSNTGAHAGEATPAESLTALPGFKIELLYSVPKEQDSWVCMTPDPKGRLIVSGQGGPLFRVTPGKDAESTKVEQLPIPIGQAQGLLWAFNSLYVDVNGGGIAGHGAGFYRIKSPDGDTFGEPELLIKLNAGGEHGPHAIRLGPDHNLYVLAGNFTDPPKELAATSPLKDFAEDQLTPRQPDGNGFATGRMAPGGWIIRCDENGKNAELFCAGFRNPYDMDFNPDGELFTWDADMEWDIGAPWYRPTRVCMAYSGGEYGWRYGTGKWPEYFEDSLPPVVNTGLGSPTGVTFGTGAKFPARFQRAMFGLDWAYGKIDVFDVVPDGAGYRATFELFISGKAFDPTDVVINTDGAMYFTIGGRGTQSGLYRVTYVGSESTEPVQPITDAKAAEARAIRHKLESFHGHRDPAAIDAAWEYLNSSDRYLRFAARVAVEWQEPVNWQQRALDEKRPTASVESLIALSRVGDKSLEPKILQSLGRLQFSSLTRDQLLMALRAYGLCFIRMGPPAGEAIKPLQARFDALYPSSDNIVNRELCRMLTYLDAPSVVPKSMALLAAANTQEDQLFYVFILRTMKDGWSMEQRKQYFSWLNLAEQKYHGGASFMNFLKHIREDAQATLTPAEQQELASIINRRSSVDVVKVTAPRQFVRNWQMPDLLPDLSQTTHGRNFERGRSAFESVQCLACHKFKDAGGSIGPDLTAVGNRFTAEYVLESILLPSKVISDQYANTQIVTSGHDVIEGRVMKDEGGKLVVRPSPLSDATVTVDKKDIVRTQLSKISPMPEGLVDVLSKEEILDLIAYLRSAGNPDDKAFKP
jgi:putative heme-binding domain-containing protein